MLLFPCVLRGKALEQQLDFLEERGGKCGCLQSYAHFLQEIDNLSKAALLAAKLKKISSDDQLHNFLSVVASSVEIELDDQTISLMPNFSEIDNSLTRCYALQVIYRSKNQKAIQSFLKSNWSSDSAESNGECAWGSWLLAEYGRELPFSEISRRVSIKHLDYAVKKRSFKPEEIVAYGEILNLRMPDSHVQTDALAEVIKLCPEYVGQWVEAGVDHGMTRHCQFFYESLCEVLLEQHPEQGAKLFLEMRSSNHRTVDSDTGIPLLLFSLFKVGDSEEIFSLRHALLKKAVTDNDLFEIAFLAQKHDRFKWLDETITAYLQSDFALDVAKGLFLLGFMDVPSAGEQLDAWIAEKKLSWLRSCAEQAKRKPMGVSLV